MCLIWSTKVQGNEGNEEINYFVLVQNMLSSDITLTQKALIRIYLWKSFELRRYHNGQTERQMLRRSVDE